MMQDSNILTKCQIAKLNQIPAPVQICSFVIVGIQTCHDYFSTLFDFVHINPAHFMCLLTGDSCWFSGDKILVLM